MNSITEEIFADFIDELISNTIDQFEHSWEQLEIDLYRTETFEVTGGLLSRQAVIPPKNRGVHK